jgi:hypothetical protein
LRVKSIKYFSLKCEIFTKIGRLPVYNNIFIPICGLTWAKKSPLIKGESREAAGGFGADR